jgi:hypothetical protein
MKTEEEAWQRFVSEVTCNGTNIREAFRAGWSAARIESAWSRLHRHCIHPDYEYATTTGPRKTWYDSDKPPEGDGWERNIDRGCPNEGWERFDYYEESYWRRPKPNQADKSESATPATQESES